MKRHSSIFATLLLACSFMLGGCTSVPQEALTNAGDNALICDGFILLMNTGGTTREQEQAFILANRHVWHSQNFALNDVPLPADLVPGAEPMNLLELLQKDPKIRAKAREVAEALQPDGSGPDGSGSGN